MKCGRGPGGENAAAPGVCPAATARLANGVNGGRNGGRGCWALAGTFCRGEVSGIFAAKHLDCMTCGFFKLVGSEEGDNYVGAKSILARVQGTHSRAGRNSLPRRRRQVPR
jgi:hypothetical protein